jgi:hypothetical protein
MTAEADRNRPKILARLLVDLIAGASDMHRKPLTMHER